MNDEDFKRIVQTDWYEGETTALLWYGRQRDPAVLLNIKYYRIRIQHYQLQLAYAHCTQDGIESLCLHLEKRRSLLIAKNIRKHILDDPASPLSVADKVYLASYPL